jgi:hypothetical protein
MLTALAILGMLVVVCSIAGVILIAVIVSQALQKQALVLDRAHERWVKHTEDLHTRLMAKDWQQYVEIKTFEEEAEGGFFTPDEQETDESKGDVRSPKVNWGSLRASAEEERLFLEDFDDDGEPIRRIPS